MFRHGLIIIIVIWKGNVSLSPEKRVEMLLTKLEEAIAVGQFDKAAVLAKELA